MITHLEIKADLSINDAGAVTGIAWPFGAPDSVGDIIEPGAFGFVRSLPIVMEHDQERVVGIWETMTETDRGLEVKGHLFVDGIKPAEDARQSLKAGRMSGLSIGYQLHEHKARPEGGRVLTSITVTEISLCRRPVHPGARISEIKSHKDTVMTPEEIAAAEAAAAALAVEHAAAIAEVKALTTRLDKVEAKANRPVAANSVPAADNDNVERKAFTAYLKQGIDRISPDEVKALTLSTNANGGFLAPQEFGTELIKLLREYSPLRQYAKVIGIESASIIYPRRLTSTSATWVSEIAARTESGMTFEQVTLNAFELATYTDVSNQLLADNVYNLEGELLADYAETFGKVEGLAFVNGTGSGQPKGIMTATGIAEVKTGAAAAFPGTNPADVLIGMYHKIPTTFAQAGVWLMNRNTLSVIRTWKDTTGQYLVLNPITQGGASTLLGRPIVEMLDMDDIGANKYPIIFGDMSGYRIVDRVGIDTLRDPYTIRLVGQTRFHASKRVGADVTHPDRFVKLKCAA